MGYPAVDLEPDHFRSDTPLPDLGAAKARRRLPSHLYLGSRPPMRWLERANALGKAPLATGIAIWFKHGVQQGKSASIRIDASLRRSMGLSRDQARRGVHALEVAGLVRVHRGGRGRCAEVTIVTRAPEPSVAPV